jgi:hypothetical protein
MYWWQWVLQITGAWLYLGLFVTGLWSVISSRLKERKVPQNSGQETTLVTLHKF